jgi:tripartite-type tricarboxylate transporter receptor subunit TctC
VERRLVARRGRAIRASVLAMAALVATSAVAQSPADKYPDKPIKIIVPFAPGGSTDVLARVIGQKMTESWGQPVIVETRPGA